MKPLNTSSKSLGFAVPLLSLRTEQGPCGEFPDIAALAGLARLWKMDLIQLLPVNDTGSQTSPYSALSAFALNPIYLRLGDLPEAKGSAAEASTLGVIAVLSAELGPSSRVSYQAILSRKLKILSRIWTMARAEGGASFLREIEDWADSQPWVKPYACFVELKRRNAGLPWWEWKDLREPKDADIDRLWNSGDFIDATRFWGWIQMRASQQFSEACQDARRLGIDIMGDIPILMNADSVDVWHKRAFFDTGLSAGAPPDMYSRLGQNWGFPLYRWDAIERDDFSFWKERLATADAYYSLYRIDHVLGFFRIWAIGKQERDGFLGRFEPEYTISYPELNSLGFDALRIHWLSKPHLPGWVIEGALDRLPDAARGPLAARLFERIGNEDLFLFVPWVHGGADIVKAVEQAVAESFPARSPWEGIQACEEALLVWWRNRTLLETTPGKYIPSWEYESTQAWTSLSNQERTALAALIARRKAESLALWEKSGRHILSVLSGCVDMKPCAEDLGAVPPCVPAVLGELGIPGLRVLRWHREWDKEGNPYVPLAEYPENSVACTSVHDSTSLRQWWAEEADRKAVWAFVRGAIKASRRAPR
ncbi:MAG: 4-alpha-glucanotransferase [Spirochaetes bacterium]|nr:4-alpha-glucanotransferase [Spirochaetota bacterium]